MNNSQRKSVNNATLVRRSQKWESLEMRKLASDITIVSIIVYKRFRKSSRLLQRK
ncbi:hypothetical protein KHA80_05930 [Anaerobacillus sp. HL2]|nr:hypothetical protein KHA80_05930 [Anaerobacillus sp. HL2]